MNNMLKLEEVSHNLYHLNRVTEQRCMLLRLYGAGCVGMKSAVGGVAGTGEHQHERRKRCRTAHVSHHKSHMDWPGIEPGFSVATGLRLT